MWMVILYGAGILIALWLLAEIVFRLTPTRLDFYSSITSERARELQAEFGVQVNQGCGWIHLAWAADPRNERYRVDRLDDGSWTPLSMTTLGSFLWKTRQAAAYRVWAIGKKQSGCRLIGEVHACPTAGTPPLHIPVIKGKWKLLFLPQEHGYYVNDHTIYRDRDGVWRLLGITSKTNGDFSAERYFASASSQAFLPAEGMKEEGRVADFGSLAWAPFVLQSSGKWHLFWSPYQLHQMDSEDGIHWQNHFISLPAPVHRHFRDAMVLQVAENQWLLYATGRRFFFSRVDIYQSFNLREWQYIRPALVNSWGSERNSAYASTESPTVFNYRGRYYLSVTFNNDTSILSGLLLLLKIWLRKETYNDTRIFHSDNPYDFGIHRGLRHSPTLVTQLKTHAPEWIYVEEQTQWYITTCGWQWAATLTNGEVAFAELEFEPVETDSSVTVHSR